MPHDFNQTFIKIDVNPRLTLMAAKVTIPVVKTAIINANATFFFIPAIF